MRTALSGSFSFRQTFVYAGSLHSLCDSKEGEDSDQQPGRVEFVPGQTVTGGAGMRMVIVVPAFSEGQKSNPPIVARIVSRCEAPGAPHVGGRIHKPSGMQPDDSSQATAPKKHGQSANGV